MEGLPVTQCPNLPPISFQRGTRKDSITARIIQNDLGLGSIILDAVELVGDLYFCRQDVSYTRSLSRSFFGCDHHEPVARLTRKGNKHSAVTIIGNYNRRGKREVSYIPRHLLNFAFGGRTP